MNSSEAQSNTLLAEDVVAALTGSAQEGEQSRSLDYATLVEHTTVQFDRREADAFCRSLLDSLVEEPGNLPQLEALIVLGLAYPDVLEKNRISLAVEGRRLAVLLERDGESERARGVLELLASHMPDERMIDHELAGMLRRTGNTEELVERYLDRAERAVQHGSIAEAIPWLQEVLLLDRSRRDVARMIRDLRFQEAERSKRRSRRAKFVVAALLISTAATAAVARDLQVREEMALLPQSRPSDAASMAQRQAALEGMIAKHQWWTSIGAARAEVASLGHRQQELKLQEEQRAKQSRELRLRRLEMAEVARDRGVIQAEKGRLSEAIQSFQGALDQAPEDWEHRSSVQTDLDALLQYQEEIK